jgi:hypothetical protein
MNGAHIDAVMTLMQPPRRVRGSNVPVTEAS